MEGSVIVALIAMVCIVTMELAALYHGHDGMVLSASVGAIVAVALKREDIYEKLKSGSATGGVR